MTEMRSRSTYNMCRLVCSEKYCYGHPLAHYRGRQFYSKPFQFACIYKISFSSLVYVISTCTCICASLVHVHVQMYFHFTCKIGVNMKNEVNNRKVQLRR